MFCFILFLLLNPVLICSFYIPLRAGVSAEVITLSGDGSTILTLDKMDAKAKITVFKRLALTYHTIVVTNLYGWMPGYNKTNIDNQYIGGQLKINKPVLNYNGSTAYLIDGDTGRFVIVSLSNISIANPKVSITKQYPDQHCPPFQCIFILYNPISKQLSIGVLMKQYRFYNILPYSNLTTGIQNAGLLHLNGKLLYIIYEVGYFSLYEINSQTNSPIVVCDRFTTNCFNSTYNSISGRYYIFYQNQLFPRSLRNNKYYFQANTINSGRVINTQGYQINTLYINLIDSSGNSRGRRLATFLSYAQLSDSNNVLGFAYDYQNEHFLDLVYFNTSLQNSNYLIITVTEPNFRIIEKEQISFFDLNYQGNVIAYYLANSKELVVMQHSGQKQTVYPCNSPQFMSKYFSQCLNHPAISSIALTLSILSIVLHIIACIISKRNSQNATPTVSPQQNANNQTMQQLPRYNLDTKNLTLYLQ